MKIEKVITEIYEFDYDEELKRLNSCFKGKQLKRQLAILDAVFKDRDLEKAQELLYALPRCKERECSEAEYCGLWLSIFTGGWDSGGLLIESDVTFEF